MRHEARDTAGEAPHGVVTGEFRDGIVSQWVWSLVGAWRGSDHAKSSF